MRRRTFLAATGTSLTASVAGCSGVGNGTPTATPTGRTTYVNFQNGSDWTLVFTAVAVPEGLGGVTIEYRDGSERTLAAETVDDIPSDAWDGAVTFYPGNDVPRRQFRSTGGSGTGIEFANTTAGTTVVTTVTRPAVENSMRSLGSGTCGEADSSRFEVAVDADGRVSQQMTCTDESSE
jgi:hypothetical protein